MSIDYDLFIIRPSNTGTTESQLRDCIADAIENLELRIKMLENGDKEETKPTEPLIKDPKIRKAVRAWAEANRYSSVKVGYDMASEPNNGNVQIHFEGTDIVDEDKYGIHTIAELCGKETK